MGKQSTYRALATWGNGDFGRLGHGASCTSLTLPRICKALLDLEVRQVSCGGAHTAVVTDTGQVFTMGLNDNGQLGHSQDALFVPVPQEVRIPESVAFVSAGHYHTLCVSVTGNVWAWGSNKHGQLGIGSKTRGSGVAPQLVTALEGAQVKCVSAGSQHSVAAAQSGEVYSWGSGHGGRCGHGPTSFFSFASQTEWLPRLIRSLVGVHVTAVAAGHTHSGCVDSGGSVFTWGDNRFWQLGHEKGVEYSSPTLVPGLHAVRGLALGGAFSAAVSGSGALMMWGADDSYVLGMGRSTQNSLRTPQQVPRFMCDQVSCGWKHCAASTAGGGLYGWGWGGSVGSGYESGAMQSTGGQLGLGDENDYWQPTRVTTLQGVDDELVCQHQEGDAAEYGWRAVQASCGLNHTAAVVEVNV